MLEQIAQYLVELLDRIGILGIFIATTVESFFAPIPSEIVLVTAGFFSSEKGSFLLLILIAFVGALGNFIGTLPFYLISRFAGQTFLPKFIKKYGGFLLVSIEQVKKAERFFEKKGSITVFLTRLVPGLRSLIAFPAGLCKMNFLKYTLFTLAGSFLWNIILGSIGYFSYQQREIIFELLAPFEKIVIILIIVLFFIYSINVILKIFKQKNA